MHVDFVGTIAQESSIAVSLGQRNLSVSLESPMEIDKLSNLLPLWKTILNSF
jgi:hypothetical protein